jgi:hypothetical protein
VTVCSVNVLILDIHIERMKSYSDSFLGDGSTDLWLDTPTKLKMVN